MEEERESKKQKIEETPKEEVAGNPETNKNKSKEAEKKTVERNHDGDAMFSLSMRRKCFVRKWKKNVLIDIRETYEKNEKILPGKKGISLSVAQYKELKKLILEGDIDNEIEALGGGDDNDGYE